MSNGWTGGQYSAYRIVFGLYLLIHFAGLLPRAAEIASGRGSPAAYPLIDWFPNVLDRFDSPGFAVGLVAAAMLLSVFFAAGYLDRESAVLLAYVWACLAFCDPSAPTPASLVVCGLLLAHAVLPGAPFGSLRARGRTDPAGGWRMPGVLFAAAWVFMALLYAYGAVDKLMRPAWVDGSALQQLLQARPGVLRDLLLMLPVGLLRVGSWIVLGLGLVFAPLSIFRRARPWIWTVMLAMQLVAMLTVDLVDMRMGMVLLHFLTFDPAWIRPARSEDEDLLFYDGSCGLCHASVRAVLAEDRSEQAFRFAPLGGARFVSSVSEARRRDIPDSLVILKPDGTLLTQSRAVVHIGKRLGGFWRLGFTALGLIPSMISDRLYDLVATVRHRLFRRPAQVCPNLPAPLRSRFDD